MRACLLVAVAMTLLTAQAGQKRQLPLFVAQAAAAVKDALPGSEAKIQGTIAVVKKNAVVGAKSQGAPAAATGGKTAESLAADGAVFIIRAERCWAKQPISSGSMAVKAPVLPKTPVFDPAHAKLVRGAYHTTGVQVFEPANVVLLVDIWFGARADTAALERAYAALTQFATTELKQ
jgi:hypothetical protein